MEEKIKIIITDTHFGVKNNSSNFLKSQLKIFNELKTLLLNSTHKSYDLIHLGDIFDSRSTISIFIQEEVRKLFLELYNILISLDKTNRIIFVAGNHDFYSPESDIINSLETIILPAIPNAVIVSKKEWLDGEDLYVPWFIFNDIDKLYDVYKRYKFKNIFTHADLRCFGMSNSHLSFLNNITIYSGHIHKYILYNPLEKKHNLSPPYSMDFGDTNNDKKGIWMIVGGDLRLHKNNVSIQFHSLLNKEIFNIPDIETKISRGDNFNIYISKKNLSKQQYIKHIKYLSGLVKYINIIPISDESIINEDCSENVNIEIILDKLFNDHLSGCFDIIKNKISEI